MTLGELIAALQDRADGQCEWLTKNHPEVFEDQRHIVTGTIERAYWHYGSLSAICDTLRQLNKLDPSLLRPITSV